MVDDPIRGSTAPDRCWTLTNVSEASPLVLTTLEWSIWSQAVELGARAAWCDFGFLRRRDVRRSDVQDELITGCFFGRQAMNVDLTREIMGMIPGSSADDFERDMLGEVRPDAKPVPDSLRRLPIILAKAPRVLATQRRSVQRCYDEQMHWWRQAVLPGEPDDPYALLEESVRRFVSAMRVHVRSRTLLQGFQAQALDVCASAGRPELAHAVLSGYGGVAETVIAQDMWRLGRGELPLEGFIRLHGFHGANEGNPRSHSWREEPHVVAGLATMAASRDSGSTPAAREEASVRRRIAAEAEILAALPSPRRPLARAVLKATGQQVRNLELGKAAFVAAIDGCRRSARLIGDQLVSQGLLSDRELVFHLTRYELRTREGDLAAVTAERAAAHAEYEDLELPVTFIGMPVPLRAEARHAELADRLTGAPGAPGVATGTVRVVLDPSAGDDLAEGEILVCHTTDPGWAPLFSLAAGLVIDIGGPLSHGAIVARELGIPCAIGTRVATVALRTGDEVRVDGSAGTVEVLSRP